MTSDLSAVEAVLHHYLDGLYVGDTERLAAIFLPQSHLYASIKGTLSILPLADWLERIRNRQSARDAGHVSTNRIISIDINGTSALAKVTCSHPPSRFTDYVNLVKVGDDWKIIAKVYNVDTVGE
jgi:4-oxalocrotonate tautomerase